VERIECDGRSGGLICEAFEVIEFNYVDPVSDRALASGAAAALGQLDPAQPGTGIVCALPNAVFEVVCDAMVVAGASSKEAEEAAVNGMLAALDSNSAYIDPEALRLLNEEQSGEVEGIGAVVVSEDLTAEDPTISPCPLVSDTCRLVVVSVFSDSPAERAGLLPGDVMVAVDGQLIDGWEIEQVTAAVRGPALSEVVLTTDRNGHRQDLVIVRAALTIPVVESSVVGDVGYLRLNLFTDRADRQVRAALSDLLAGGVDRLVIDLRDNPGGALDATVNIASEFLSAGVVVTTQSPDQETDYQVGEGGLFTNTELAVAILVNRGSASAAEVLSAALQERHRATIIGENTFGKNTVQQRFTLSNGGAIRLTVARWVTAGGSSVGGEGITPDIAADLDRTLSVAELVAAVSDLTGWS
jgi:carboxyl-terminal processing protease